MLVNSGTGSETLPQRIRLRATEKDDLLFYDQADKIYVTCLVDFSRFNSLCL